MPTPNSQPNATKNPAPDTHELDNTLEKLRSLMKQTQPPKARANPLQGGAPRIGGAPNGDLTARLTGVQRGAIGDQLRECYGTDPGAVDAARNSGTFVAILDSQGVIREAVIAPQDTGRLSDPRFQAFFERARRAALDPHCANIGNILGTRVQLGAVNRLTIHFNPG